MYIKARGFLPTCPHHMVRICVEVRVCMRYDRIWRKDTISHCGRLFICLPGPFSLIRPKTADNLETLMHFLQNSRRLRP
jgi:hypothetical protein